MRDRRHLFFWPVLAIGVALIVMPFALSIPSKADAAQSMLNGFRPIMRAANVAKTAESYYDKYVKPAAVAHPDSPALTIALAVADHARPVIDALQANDTSFQQLDNLPSISLFVWILVIPGILLVLVSGVPLAVGLTRRKTREATRSVARAG